MVYSLIAIASWKEESIYAYEIFKLHCLCIENVEVSSVIYDLASTWGYMSYYTVGNSGSRTSVCKDFSSC